MQASGDITVDVDRATAFAFVRDPERLAGCIPGCHDLRETAPGQFTALLTSKVAFMTLSFKVAIEVVKMEPPSTIEATITGDAVGIPGRLVATASVQLADAGPSRTTIHYATDVGLAGRLGGLGEPVFRATSAQLAKEFGAKLKAAIEAAGAEKHA